MKILKSAPSCMTSKNQEKSGGRGDVCRRLLRTYVSVIYAFTIFIYSICAQTKNIEDSVCKNARRVEEERKTRSTAGGPFILPWREGVREGVCIIRRDAQPGAHYL